ncbi:MAG: hypothetical protein ABF979_15940 [Gluconobacter sp.]|uniref:hypothetical protein n=1 Tax=Gluconobacter sp. TaxID=1876758 RepID=UPI0039E963A2
MTDPKFTKGPWAWFGSAGGCPDVYLATKHSGRKYVMSFRRWGMRGAQPQFRSGNVLVDASELLKFEVGDKSIVGIEAARKDTSVYRYQVRGIDSPDAHLIAAAPELYEALDACLSLVLSQELQDGFESQQGHMARAALAKARGETS